MLIGFFFRCLFFSVSSCYISFLLCLFLLHFSLPRFSCYVSLAAFPLLRFPCRFSLAAFPLLRFLCCVSLAAFPLLCFPCCVSFAAFPLLRFPCCVSLAASLCLPVHYVRQRLNNIFIVSGHHEIKIILFCTEQNIGNHISNGIFHPLKSKKFC